MPEIVRIEDLEGQPLYSDFGQAAESRKCTAWYVSDGWVPSSPADSCYVEKCASNKT